MKKGILIIFVILMFILMGCNKSTDPTFNESDLNIEINSTDIYDYKTGISGDEEDASIIVQAEHFEISDIIRNANTNYEAVYRYKPKAGFTGSDYIEIELRTGSDGASPATKIEIIKINIRVSL